MPQFYQLSANGQLHKMEAGHAGAGASNPMPANLITLSKYELCDQPSCFGKKKGGPVGGALVEKPAQDAEDGQADGDGAKEEKPRRRRVAHGVQSDE